MQLVFHKIGVAAVGKLDAHTGIEEGEFAQATLQRIEIEFDHREGFRRRQEADFRAGFTARITRHDKRCIGNAMRKAHLVNLAGATDLQFQPNRQRVHNRHADAVQTTGNLVGILVELAAGVKLGHDDLGCRNAFFLMDIGRDAAAIVGHGAGPVRVESDGHKRGMSCQRFVDRIVHDLVDHMMQAGAVIRVADIHAGALANGIQTFQNTNGIRAIFGGGFGIHLGHLAHENLSKNALRMQLQRYVESRDKHGFNIGANGHFSKFWR